MPEKPHSPATERNREAILDVLRYELASRETVLEIGSGTGQHAVFFAKKMPQINWQTSDCVHNHGGINAWLETSALKNVNAPLALDVLEPIDLKLQYDAVFSANTAHIMSLQAVECMFEVVDRFLTDDGVFCLYGPFNMNGTFTSSSNERFDASLKMQDPAMGIRELEDLDRFAAAHNLKRERLYAMPANNNLAVWCRG